MLLGVLSIPQQPNLTYISPQLRHPVSAPSHAKIAEMYSQEYMTGSLSPSQGYPPDVLR